MDYTPTRSKGNNWYKWDGHGYKDNNETALWKRGKSGNKGQRLRNSRNDDNNHRQKSRGNERSVDRIKYPEIIDAKKFIQMKNNEIKQRNAKTPDRGYMKHNAKVSTNTSYLRKGIVNEHYMHQGRNVGGVTNKSKNNLFDEREIHRGGNMNLHNNNNNNTRTRYTNQPQNNMMNRSRDYDKKRSENKLNNSRHYSRSPGVTRKNDPRLTTSNTSQDNHYLNLSNNSYSNYASHSHCSNKTQHNSKNKKNTYKYNHVLDNINNEINSVYSKNMEQRNNFSMNNNYNSNNNPRRIRIEKKAASYYDHTGAIKQHQSYNPNINSCNWARQAQSHKHKNSDNINAMSSQINYGQHYNYNNYIISNNSPEKSIASVNVNTNNPPNNIANPLFKKIPPNIQKELYKQIKTNSPLINNSNTFLGDKEKSYYTHWTKENNYTNNKETKDTSHSPHHSTNYNTSHSPSQCNNYHQYNSTNSISNVSRGNRDTSSIGSRSYHTYSNNFDDSHMETIEEMHLGFVAMIQRSRQLMSIQDNTGWWASTSKINNNIDYDNHNMNTSINNKNRHHTNSVVYVEERDIF